MDFYFLCVYVISAVLGLCVGSFLNVVIYRLPKGMSLVVPRSHCTKCGYAIKWYDNIPVISYISLKGKCRSCKQTISFRYIAVELSNTTLWLASAWCFWKINPLYAIMTAIVCSCLICIFCIDSEYMLIYDRFTNTIALAGILGIACTPVIAWQDGIIGMIAGGGIFALLYYGSLALLKKEGIGLGDVKLSAAIGLLLGWQKLILTMLIASILGSLVLTALNRANGNDKDTERPFGPFIVFGTVFALFFGDAVIKGYINFLLALVGI